MSDIEKLDTTINSIDILSKSLSDQLEKIIDFHEKIADSCEKIMTFTEKSNSDMIFEEPQKSLFLWFRNAWLSRKESFVPLFTREQLEELHESTKHFRLDRKNIEEFVYIWGMFIEPDEKMYKMIKLLHDTDLAKYNFVIERHPNGMISTQVYSFEEYSTDE